MPISTECLGSRLASVVATSAILACVASATASSAPLLLDPQPASDWPRAGAATVVATVHAPAGASVAIGIARGRDGTCRAAPSSSAFVRHVVATAPRGFALAGSPDGSRPMASTVLEVRAPRPGHTALVCAWASSGDGRTAVARATLTAPRERGTDRSTTRVAPLRLPRHLPAAVVVLCGVAWALGPRRRHGRVRRPTGFTTATPARDQWRSRSHVDRRTLLQLGNDARRGEEADAQVRAVLVPFAADGWPVSHGIVPPGGGDVDHVVQAPDGIVFAVETKAFAHVTPAALRQAARNALRVAALSDVRAERCRAVLCLAASRRADIRRYDIEGITVLVTSPDGLERLLRRGHATAPPTRADAVLRVAPAAATRRSSRAAVPT
jgi:hypothetical protein